MVLFAVETTLLLGLIVLGVNEQTATCTVAVLVAATAAAAGGGSGALSILRPIRCSDRGVGVLW